MGKTTVGTFRYDQNDFDYEYVRILTYVQVLNSHPPVHYVNC